MEEESSIISTAESGLRGLTGTDTVLARMAAAELSLIGYDQSAIVMRSGEFMVRVISQSASPLSMAVCMVGDHQWPIAMDTPVLKVGPRKFSFALPGFFHGLVLPDSCTDSDLKRLEGILKRFCAYEDLSSRGENPNFSTGAADFLPSLLPSIEKSSNRLLKDKKTESQPKVATTAGVGNLNGTSNPAQKAMRTSAVVKLVSQAFLRGAIDLNLHVQILGPTSDASAFASVRAFTDVVDAVETAGRSIAGDAHRGATVVDSKCWIFSKSGLTLLLRAVAAMAVVHVARNSVASARAEEGERAAELTSDSCLTGSNSVEKAVEACGS